MGGRVSGANLVSDKLGRALKGLRDSLSLSGRDFVCGIAEHGGPHIDYSRLSRIENGRRGLDLVDWHALLAASTALGAQGAALDRLAALLPAIPPPIEPLPSEDLGRIVTRWAALARRQRDAVELFSQPAATFTDSDDLNILRCRSETLEVLRVAEAARDGVAPAADSRDAVRLVRMDPARPSAATDEFFEVRLELRNSGPVVWRDRLLVRIGPIVTSTIALTPPLLPVPVTMPGDTCEIVVPGRAHHLGGLCVVTYAMTFADGSPAVRGGLAIPVLAVAGAHRTLPLTQQLSRVLRGE